MIGKYPPIQGGVSVQTYWLAQALVDLGHNVAVLTNADEVEDEFRLQLSEQDNKLLYGYRKQDSILLKSTVGDDREVFIPQSKAYTSKLVSLGLEMIDSFRPDCIYSHYLEPYGITALFLSKLTGVPFVVRHAGSDLGKLGLLPQMSSLHQRVYREATLIATREGHHEYFRKIGVTQDKLAIMGFRPYPPDVFFSTPIPKLDKGIRVVVYGKTGKHKGTPQIIEALKHTKAEITLTAHWGGRYLKKYRTILESDLLRTGKAVLKPYIPHWEIAKAIRDSHAVLYLENCFGIGIHTPVIPYEVMSCGRLLITTKEIANKYPHIINAGTSVILEHNPVHSNELASVLDSLPHIIQSLGEEKREPLVDSTAHYAFGLKNLELFLEKVRDRI